MKNFMEEWKRTKNINIIHKFLKESGSAPAIQKEFGGSFTKLSDLFDFNFELAKDYGDLNFSLTILINHIILLFIDRFGTKEIKEKYLAKAMKEGLIFSFAVSEPEVGPHPKHLKTKALSDNGVYHISGVKTFISNASTCDYTIVIAITSEDKRKNYSALIVDMKNNKNIRCKKIKNLPFFKDSDHGTIFFNSTQTKDILGEKGTAYEKIVLEFRKYEDILMSAPVLGSISYIFNKKIKSHITNSSDLELIKEAASMFSKLETLKYLCQKSCEELEQKNIIADHIHLFFRKEAKEFISNLKNLCKKISIDLDETDKNILTDLELTGNIALKNTINKAIKLYFKGSHEKRNDKN